MRLYMTALAIAGALAAAPAHAQQQSIETQLLLANQDCSTQSGAPNVYAAASVVAVCTDALARLRQIGTATRHDANVFHAMNVVARMGLATAYGTIDRSRSRRSCDVAEQGWMDAVQIDPSLSPDNVAGYLREIISKARAMVQVCRNDFGTAAGAAPLSN